MRRNYIVLEEHYHTTTLFTENLLAIEMRKTQRLINKSAYLGLPILDLGRSVI